MDDRDVARPWDENAPDWVRGVREGYDVYRDLINNPAFFEMLGEVKGLRVLDVGCGEGTNTRMLADRGASVVGVDISEAMLGAARECEAIDRRGIAYHATSGSDLSRFAADSFDLIVSTMAMMDMADYAGCVREVARVLKPGCVFQFSISHPCVMTRRWKWIKDEEGRRLGVVAGDYFSLEESTPQSDVDEWYFGAAPAEVKAAVRPFRIPRFFRTLSEYVNVLLDNGFAIERLAEPHAGEQTAIDHPAVADTRVVPYFLILRSRLNNADN